MSDSLQDLASRLNHEIRRATIRAQGMSFIQRRPVKAREIAQWADDAEELSAVTLDLARWNLTLQQMAPLESVQAAAYDAFQQDGVRDAVLSATTRDEIAQLISVPASELFLPDNFTRADVEKFFRQATLKLTLEKEVARLSPRKAELGQRLPAMRAQLE